MRLFGLFGMIVGCLMAAPALALLAGGPAVYDAMNDAFGPVFPFVSNVFGEIADKARVMGSKMMATALVMIIGGLYLHRTTNKPHNDEQEP